MGDVARAGERVGCRERPLRGRAGEGERARLVGQRRTVESGSSTIQPSTVSSSWSSTSRGSSGSCRKPRRKPVAQITCSAPFTAARRGSALARRALERLVEVPPGRIRRREQLAQARGALARREPVEAGEAARARSTRAGRSAAAAAARAAGRRRPRARRERVQPLRRRREAGADDGHARRVLVRLVRVDDARIVRAAPSGTAGPGCPARRARARSGRCPSSSKPPSTARDPPDPRLDARLWSQPLRSRSSLDVREELLDRRVVAVAAPLRGAAAASAAAERWTKASPGKVVGRQCPSLSERMSRWRIAAARRRQAAAGSSLGAEDGDLVRARARRGAGSGTP